MIDFNEYRQAANAHRDVAIKEIDQAEAFDEHANCLQHMIDNKQPITVTVESVQDGGDVSFQVGPDDGRYEELLLIVRREITIARSRVQGHIESSLIEL